MKSKTILLIFLSTLILSCGKTPEGFDSEQIKLEIDANYQILMRTTKLHNRDISSGWTTQSYPTEIWVEGILSKGQVESITLEMDNILSKRSRKIIPNYAYEVKVFKREAGRTRIIYILSKKKS